MVNPQCRLQKHGIHGNRTGRRAQPIGSGSRSRYQQTLFQGKSRHHSYRRGADHRTGYGGNIEEVTKRRTFYRKKKRGRLKTRRPFLFASSADSPKENSPPLRSSRAQRETFCFGCDAEKTKRKRFASAALQLSPTGDILLRLRSRKDKKQTQKISPRLYKSIYLFVYR